MKRYGSYNFIDKDPVIDIMRSLVDLEVKVSGRSFNYVLKDITNRSGVTYGCLLGWFYGRTISPRFSSLQRVAHALNVEFNIGEKSSGKVVRFRRPAA